MSHIRFSSMLLATTLLGSGIASAATLQVMDGCAPPPAALSGNVYYIDPVHGSAAGDGSQAHPWNSLASINGTAQYANPAWQLPGCNNNSSCANGPLLSTQVYSHTDPVSKKNVTSVNPNAPIKPGDTILLMNGNYGDVSINGVANPSFIAIAAAPNQKPVLNSLQLVGSAMWLVQGLKFRGLADDYSPFIDIYGNSWYGAGHDIIIDSNNLASQDNVNSWTQADWVSQGRFAAISVDGGDQHSTYEKCVALTNNIIKNVRWGIVAAADNMLISGNKIDNFGDDGMDFAANNLIISRNRITNSHDIGDSNHNDAMQGQIGRGVNGTTFNNILIDGNIVIAQTRRNLPFPGELQGITAFDMDWSNLQAINNIVVTNTYHGMSFYSLHNGLVANNTVLGTNSQSVTWLGVMDQSHQGSLTNNVVVRNNIASILDMETTSATVTADHNLVRNQIIWSVNGQWQWLSQPGTYANSNTVDPVRLAGAFKKFDNVGASYNVHLMPNSRAVGTGNPVAPPTMGGGRRRAPVDLGAYEYLPPPTTAAAKAAAKLAENAED